MLRDEGVVLPVSSVLANYLGVSDVALSVPTIVNRQGASRAIEVRMSEQELEKFRNSAATLRKSIEVLGLG